MEEQTTMPDNKIKVLEKRLQLFRLFFIIQLIYFFLSLPLIYYLFNAYQTTKGKKETQKEKVQIVPKSEPISFNYEPKRKFIIKGSEVIEITDVGEEVIFTNIENIEEVRLGPDGGTLHFKVVANKEDQYCANLAGKVVPDPDPSTSLSDTPPPAVPPWNYKRLGEAYTVPVCGENGRTGGYLKESNYFAFIEQRSPKEFYLIIQNLSDLTLTSIRLDPGIVNEENNFSWIKGSTSQSNGYTYYYPQADSKYTDEKLVIAIGRLIIALDVPQKRLLGTLSLIEPDYNIVLNSFWFLTQEDSPLILVESGWEGALRFQTLIDLSNNKLKVVPLVAYDQGLLGFHATRAEWKDNGVVFYFHERIDISDEAGISDDDWTRVDLDNLASQLKASGNYIDVYCTLIAEAGCFAITNTNLDRYRYTPSGNLTRF